MHGGVLYSSEME